MENNNKKAKHKCYESRHNCYIYEIYSDGTPSLSVDYTESSYEYSAEAKPNTEAEKILNKLCNMRFQKIDGYYEPYKDERVVELLNKLNSNKGFQETMVDRFTYKFYGDEWKDYL